MDLFDCCGKPSNSEDLKRVIANGTGKLLRYCKLCVSGNGASIPDVWYGYGSGIHTEENICDPKTGKPIPFYDKQSKAAAMKMAGIREAGDKVHGARNEEGKRRTYFM